MIVGRACSGAESDHSQYHHIGEPHRQAFQGQVSSQFCMVQIPTYLPIYVYPSNQPIEPGQDLPLLELLRAPGDHSFPWHEMLLFFMASWATWYVVSSRFLRSFAYSVWQRVPEPGNCRSSNTSAASLGLRPYIRKYGLRPVVWWRVQLYACTSCGTNLFQFRFCYSSKVRSMEIKVLLKRSVQPFPIGWYGVVRDFFMPAMAHSSLMILLSKFLPWSLWILVGNP